MSLKNKTSKTMDDLYIKKSKGRTKDSRNAG